MTTQRFRDWLLAVAAGTTLAAVLILTGLSSPAVPACAEDAVLVGTGSFDHGRWTAYECGPAVDDYAR